MTIISGWLRRLWSGPPPLYSSAELVAETYQTAAETFGLRETVCPGCYYSVWEIDSSLWENRRFDDEQLTPHNCRAQGRWGR